MQKSPILDTILGFLENALSPIMVDDPFTLKSRTGEVFILTPISFISSEVLSINNL